MTPEEITALESLVRQARAEQVDGRPLVLTSYRDAAPVVLPAPAPAPKPYGAYIGVGVLGIAGVTALGFVAAILAVALSIGAVSLTVCAVILRSVWQDYQASQASREK